MFNHLNKLDIIDLKSETVHNKRWYTLPDGSKVPSVTTILGQKEKPKLLEWRNSLGSKKADKETQRCADRGTAIHLIAENYLKNNENHSKGQKTEYVRLFNQLKLRLNKIDNIIAQEIALYSKRFKIAGRCDCIAEYEGVLSIIDFKTSNNNKDLEMIEDYFLQATAYALMCYEQYDLAVEDIVILIAVEKGMVPLVFKAKIDNYIKPLIERINMYYKTLEGKS